VSAEVLAQLFEVAPAERASLPKFACQLRDPLVFLRVAAGEKLDLLLEVLEVLEADLLHDPRLAHADGVFVATRGRLHATLLVQHEVALSEGEPEVLRFRRRPEDFRVAGGEDGGSNDQCRVWVRAPPTGWRIA